MQRAEDEVLRSKAAEMMATGCDNGTALRQAIEHVARICVVCRVKAPNLGVIYCAECGNPMSCKMRIKYLSGTAFARQKIGSLQTQHHAVAVHRSRVEGSQRRPSSSGRTT